MGDSPPHILVLAAHPDLRVSRVHRALLDALRPLQAERGGALDVRDLYALYPDYLIDVHAEQQAALQADLIVWQHPIHWYSMPPMMKLWLDEVLAFGWAYGAGTQALKGRHLWLVSSTGGPESSYRPEGYNRHPFSDFLPPYQQTAALCGLCMAPPLILHGAHQAGRNDIAGFAATYIEQLRLYPDWPGLATATGPDCTLPLSDRPPRVRE